MWDGLLEGSTLDQSFHSTLLSVIATSFQFLWMNQNDAKHSNHSIRSSILTVKIVIAANDYINLAPNPEGMLEDSLDVYDDRQVRAIFTLQLMTHSYHFSSYKCQFWPQCCYWRIHEVGGQFSRGLKPTNGRNYRTFGRTQAIQILHLQSININSTLLTE